MAVRSQGLFSAWRKNAREVEKNHRDDDVPVLLQEDAVKDKLQYDKQHDQGKKDKVENTDDPTPLLGVLSAGEEREDGKGYQQGIDENQVLVEPGHIVIGEVHHEEQH